MSKFFLSNGTEKTSPGNQSVSEKLWWGKNFKDRRGGGGITAFRQNFSASLYRKNSLGNTSVYREKSGIEKFYASEREGVSHFTVENFLSHSIEKYHWGIIRCFGKYRVSKNLMHQGARGYHISPSKIFVTHYRKVSLGNTSVYREISGIKKFFALEREGLSHFSVENFLSHSTKKFRWGTLRCIRKFRISKNFTHRREGGGGVSRFSVENFCHTVSKNFVGEHSGVSGNFGYRKILCIREGRSITFLRRKLFVKQYQKISLGNTLVIQKNSGIEKFYASER